MSLISPSQKPVNANIHKLEILSVKDALFFDYQPCDVYATVYPKPGKQFEIIPATPRSIRFQDNSATSPNGVVPSYEASCKVSSISEETLKILRDIEQGYFFVKLHTRETVFLISEMQLQNKIKHKGVVASFSGFDLAFNSFTAIPLLLTTADPSPTL